MPPPHPAPPQGMLSPPGFLLPQDPPALLLKSLSNKTKTRRNFGAALTQRLQMRQRPGLPALGRGCPCRTASSRAEPLPERCRAAPSAPSAIN